MRTATWIRLWLKLSGFKLWKQCLSWAIKLLCQWQSSDWGWVILWIYSIVNNELCIEGCNVTDSKFRNLEGARVRNREEGVVWIFELCSHKLNGCRWIGVLKNGLDVIAHLYEVRWVQFKCGLEGHSLVGVKFDIDTDSIYESALWTRSASE